MRWTERLPAAPPTALSATSRAIGAEQPADPSRLREQVDAVDEAVGSADGLGWEREEEGGGSADVADGEDAAADENGPGNGAAGILDFVAHGGGGLNAAEGEEDAGPEDGVVERPVRDEAGGGDVSGRAEAHSRRAAPSNSSTVSGKQAAECADVVEPLACVRLREC